MLDDGGVMLNGDGAGGTDQARLVEQMAADFPLLLAVVDVLIGGGDRANEDKAEARRVGVEVLGRWAQYRMGS